MYLVISSPFSFNNICFVIYMYGRSVDKSVIRWTWVDFFFNIKGLFIYFKDNPCLVLVYLFLNNAILLMSQVIISTDWHSGHRVILWHSTLCFFLNFSLHILHGTQCDTDHFSLCFFSTVGVGILVSCMVDIVNVC